jgi:hypothetical protein
MRAPVVTIAGLALAACNAGTHDAANDAPIDAPVWPTCANDPRATPESLATKAAAYDRRVLGLHVHPQMPWVLDVAIAPGVDPETATVGDVVAWRSGENDGLWSAMVDHHMQFVDWDGRPTQWGKVYPGAPGGDSLGHLAVLGASFLGTAAAGTGDAELVAAYAQLGYTSYLDQISVWPGGDNCTANWNDLSMLAASFHDVIASDPANRAVWQAGFASALVGMPKGLLVEHNAWWDLLWAEATAPEPAVIEDAACALREFPRSNHTIAHVPTEPTACTGRHDEPLAAAPLSIADRCAATYAWWGNPYELASCAADPTLVQNPAGYLLPYWMARYHGFVGPND